MDSNIDIYKDLLKNTKEAQDPYWIDVLAFYKDLDDLQKDTLFKIIRQVEIDTISNVLAILDGTSQYHDQKNSFVLSTEKGDRLENELQDRFLELFEENDQTYLKHTMATLKELPSDMHKYFNKIAFEKTIDTLSYFSYLLTVYARETYHTDLLEENNFQKLIKYNEMQHKILSLLVDTIHKKTKPKLDESFFQMLAEMALEGKIPLDHIWNKIINK